MSNSHSIAINDPEYVSKLGRHFVYLSCRQMLPSQNNGCRELGPPVVISGFILSVQDIWFFVTAGHVFKKDIANGIKAGCTYENWHLNDGRLGDDHRAKLKYISGIDTKSIPDSIPFDLKLEDVHSYYDEDDGWDFAFIALVPMYRKLLETNGTVALDEHYWKFDTPLPATRLELLGIPYGTVKEDKEALGLVSKTYVCLPMQLTEPEPGDKRDHNYLLHGKIPDITLAEIGGFEKLGGMSGGPIFAIGENQYWILALQSTGSEVTQRITGFVVRPLADHIDSSITQWCIEHSTNPHTSN